MKTLYSVIPISLLIILLIVNHVSGSSKWVIYGRSNIGDVHSYNKVRIKNRTKDIVQVWCKIDYSDQSREKYIQDSMKSGLFSRTEMENLSYNIFFSEIDCKENRYRILSSSNYNRAGKVLYRGYPDKPKFDYIVPDTVIDSLRKQVCKKSKLKGSKFTRPQS